MQVVLGANDLDETQTPCAVGIGIFDGVHLGHQALLRRVVETANREGYGACAYTFDPHPASVLNPPLAPKLIEPLATRLARFARLGVSMTVVERFSPEWAAMSAEAFASHVLARKLKANHVFVGRNFTFGRGRAGTVEKLVTWGRDLDFDVHPVDMVTTEGGLVASSTKIREFIGTGTIRGATLLLGRPFVLQGVAERGVGRGSQLGFPTANVRVANELVPAVGVYAAYAHIPEGCFPSVVNIGFAPTFGDVPLRIEAHLMHYGGAPLYGSSISLEFIDRVRDEQRFSSVDALRAQIAVDIEKALSILNKTSPVPEAMVT